MFNLAKLYESSRQTLQRFPVTLVFLSVLSIHLMWIKIDKTNAFTFFLSVGILLSLLQHLCLESIRSTKLVKMLVWMVPILLLAADSYFLPSRDAVTASTVIAQGSAIFALFVAVCFLPFWRERNDQKSWHFVFRLVTAACIAMLVGVIMCGGLMLLYYGSCTLFGMESNSHVATILVVLSNLTIPACLFLIQIPNLEERGEIRPSNFLLGITRYLFIPLVLLYLIVLYVYGLVILFTWTLPDGMLTWLITAMMIGIIGITFLLYPYKDLKQSESPFNRVAQKLPLLVLPLLILMSVGVGRRLSDYGITANRLYVLTLNLWFYAVAIGLWLNHGRRIHWVSISFSVLLLLTSCHPWNYNAIYSNILLNRFDTFATLHPLPKSLMSVTEIDKYLDSLSKEDRDDFCQLMRDFRDFDLDLLRTRASKIDVWYISIMDNAEETGALDQIAEHSYNMSYSFEGPYTIPQGYQYMVPTSKGISYGYQLLTSSDLSNLNGSEEHEREFAAILCNDSTFTYRSRRFGHIVIPHRHLHDKHQLTIPVPGHDAVLIVAELEIYNDDKATHTDMYYRLNGYIYYNKKSTDSR